MGMTIYTVSSDVSGLEVVKSSDVFFDKSTAFKLDWRAIPVIYAIDGVYVDLESGRIITDKFGLGSAYVTRLSTGCKTLLNILYNPTICFDMIGCGDYAVWYGLYYLSGIGIYHPAFWDGGKFPVQCAITYNDILYRDVFLLIRKLREDR